MDEAPKATGIPDAVLMDVLIGFGHDVDALMAMSRDGRLEAIREAVASGQLAPPLVELLSELGVVRSSS